MSNLWRVENGKLHLALHPGQAEAWRSERRFTAVIAGSQAGKTSFGSWWLQREIDRCGAGDYLGVTSSFDLFKLKMLPELRTCFEHVLRRGRYWAGDRVMELADPETGRFWAQRAADPMWGRIVLRSAVAGGGLEASTAKAAWLDEAGQDEFGVETWEAVLRRLALAQGRVLITTTPYNLGWLKSEVYDRHVAGDRDYLVVQFASTQNPAFPEAEYERARRTMPAWRFQMFYRGEFTRPEGLIYGCFDPAHVVEPFEIPRDWPLHVGQDYGAVNTALVWLAEDRQTRRYFAYQESLSGGKTTNQHAAAAKALATGRRVWGWWGGAPSEDQQRMDWAAAGVPVQRPPIKDVEAGIDRVTQLLQDRRLFVFRSCRGLLDEFGSYRRKLDAAGQPTEEIEDKRKFHRLDALRYVAAGLAGDPAVNPLAGMLVQCGARGGWFGANNRGY